MKLRSIRKLRVPYSGVLGLNIRGFCEESDREA